MFYLYKSLDNQHLFTNTVEINPRPENLEYLGEVIKEIIPGFYDQVDGELVKVALPYDALRQRTYPKLAQQLDKLWHDIDAGLLGAPAKTGEFYTSIQAVKQEFPRD